MWTTFWGRTQGLIPGLWWLRGQCLQIPDHMEWDWSKASAAALWNTHRGHAFCGQLPKNLLSAQGYYGRSCLGDFGLLWRPALAWGVFENLTKLSLELHCSLPCFYSAYLISFSLSFIQERLVSQSDSSLSLSQLLPSSFIGIFSNTFLACLITF